MSVCITFIAVQSLNGYITRGLEPGTRFASEADQAWFRETLHAMDLTVMGGRTYRVARSFILGSRDAAHPRLVMTRDPGGFEEDAQAGALDFMKVDRKAFLSYLTGHGHRNIALVGGPAISSWFFKEGLVNELYLTLEPWLFTGGTPLVELDAEVPCELLQARPLSSQTLLLHYRIRGV